MFADNSDLSGEEKTDEKGENEKTGNDYHDHVHYCGMSNRNLE